MKRIYLFCSAGMSTSLVASRMQDVADKHNLPLEIKAFPDRNIDAIYEQYHPLGVPVDVINLEDYGNADGERILKRAIQLLKSKKEQ